MAGPHGREGLGGLVELRGLDLGAPDLTPLEHAGQLLEGLRRHPAVDVRAPDPPGAQGVGVSGPDGRGDVPAGADLLGEAATCSRSPCRSATLWIPSGYRDRTASATSPAV